MANIIKLIPFIMILQSCCLSSSNSCFIYRFWDGDYSVRSNAAELDKERRIFYENEPQEIKLLRVKNEQYCNFLSVILSVGVSIFLIIMSFIINGGYISWEEVREIIIFCFKGFFLGTPLLLLSIIISNKVRK